MCHVSGSIPPTGTYVESQQSHTIWNLEERRENPEKQTQEVNTLEELTCE